MELDNISKRIDGSKLDDALKDKIAGNIDDLTDDELKYLNDNLSDFDELQKLVSADKVDADAVKSWKENIKGKAKVFKVINIDIAQALKNRISHIRKIEFELKSNGTYKFSGCHSKSAIDDLGDNARIEITVPKNAEGVYEANVFAKGPDGLEIPKSGNQGKSTFFPDNWDETKILEETEHAVKYNKGLVDPNNVSQGYYGFSKDGKIKIRFYYRDSDGYIGSFFPMIN